MKYLLSLALVVISFVASAQNVRFKLADAKQKKWIGQNQFITESEENVTNLVFTIDMKVTEENRRYHSQKSLGRYRILSGIMAKDTDIVIELDGRQYNVEFSYTNNGHEFMTLSSIPAREEDPIVTRTYYAE
jgi:hypothetical protein